MTLDLATELAGPDFGETTSDWDGYEVNVGYGVMDLPMASGDILALRVFPRSDFGGYISVWHRDPAGAWSQYVDRAPVEAGCPRVWGPALDHAGPASIDLEWTGPAELEVRIDRPALRWRMAMVQTLPLAVLNALHAPMPLWTWRPRRLVALRERALNLLGLGPISMSGIAPSDEHLVAMLRRMYWIDRSSAQLDDRDLGGPAVLDRCPTIGDWPLPRRGVFAIGEAHGTIGNRHEYEQLRRATVGTARNDAHQ